MISLLLAVSALTILSGAGCGKSTTKGMTAGSKAFENAPPEVKEAWNKALAADAATNYTDALSLLKNLRTMQLNEAQLIALDKETTDFNQRLFDAAAKNDPAAVQAVQIMHSQR
jgi:hypothetical protein